MVPSHKEDVDGISSAPLIKATFKTKSVIVLVDYAKMFHPKFAEIGYRATERRIDRFFVCDLGLSKKNERKFLEIVGKIVSSGVQSNIYRPP